LNDAEAGDRHFGGDGALRMVAYNLGQGGRRDARAWLRLLGSPTPDLLFVQESRDPANSWLPELPVSDPEQWLWAEAVTRRWGTGLWVRSGRLAALPVPEAYRGRVVAAIVEGITWPVTGPSPAVAISIHAPTARGSSYIKEVGHILDLARAIAGGLPLILGGDFNVAVALREPNHPLYNSSGERALLTRLRDELGLLPCWQSAHPGETPARTLRWMRRLDSLPYHCDGLFVPADWIPALASCEVLEDPAWCALSDHNPVVAAFAPLSPTA
jgi:endonuclease/exonuclease/phosphatase family metal-dependent hydrolase